MKSRRLISLCLAGALMLGAMSGCAGSGGDTIDIGVLAPLTGDVSVYGITTKNGIDLAVEEINKNGGVLGKQIKINALDEKGDIAEATNAYQRLVSENIVALIGDITSKPSIAVAELAAEDKIPMLTPTGTAAAITEKGDNIFRVCFTDPFQGKIMATFAADNLKAKKVAIMYNTSDDYSQGVANAFKTTAESKGLTIVANEGYGNDDKDFKTQLTKIQSAAPDAIFIPDYYTKVALIATQARDVGYTGTLLGADGWDGVLGTLDDAKKNVVDNCYFSSHFSTNDTTPVVSDFVQNYQAKFNEMPTGFSALGYDAAYLMVEAIKNAGSTDKEAITAALKDIKRDCVTGNISFDQNGDPIKSVAVIKLNDGKADLFTKISVE